MPATTGKGQQVAVGLGGRPWSRVPGLPATNTATATEPSVPARRAEGVAFGVMATLAAYLDLDAGQAVRQWLAITQRVPKRRQDDFTPVETLLTFGCFYVIDHRHYGGSTSHLAPEPVQSLARLFVRTPASILAKMANLDGSRRNSAVHELEVFATLSSEPARYAGLYATVVTAARVAGIGTDQLADFLGLESGPGLWFLGQEELPPEDVEAAVEPKLRLVAPRLPVHEATTQKLLEGLVRLGQHRFAAQVLDNCGRTCVFCGLRPSGLGGHKLLAASHIKPWRDCDNNERLDVTNGLAACPTHDAAFDTGLLTVNGGLRVHESAKLVAALECEPTVASFFGHPPLRERLLLPEGAMLPGKAYLRWHKDKVFVGGGTAQVVA